MPSDYLVLIDSHERKFMRHQRAQFLERIALQLPALLYQILYDIPRLTVVRNLDKLNAVAKVKHENTS